ncbi:MAG: DUF1385 domain-containing protein [Thermoleophilia bacterium]
MAVLTTISTLLRLTAAEAASVGLAAAAETTRAALAADEPHSGEPPSDDAHHSARPPAGACDDACDVLGSGHTVGGQAVIDGVMMRGKRSWGLAVRQPSGAIARHSFALTSVTERYPVLKLPVLRGIVTLVESLVLGMKALGLSANLSLEGDQEASGGAAEGTGAAPAAATGDSVDEEAVVGLGWREMAVTFVIALGLAVVLFVVIPLAVVKYFEHIFSNPFVFNLVEGLIRIAIFLAYVGLISLIPDLRRVFEYHGAEHKVIHAYEAGEDLDPSNAGRFTTLHPRCGTAFLLVVMVMAILVFSVVGKPGLLLLVLSRLVGIPIVAGLSYEVIRFAGRHKDGLVSRVVLWPGLKLQRLTTREPSVEQVEVAIVALVEVLRVDAGGAPDPRGLVSEGAR